MGDFEQPDHRNKFLNSFSYYSSEFIPENVIFNTNLQEFARRVEVICGLEIGGKISRDVVYQQIQQLYQQLKQGKEALGISTDLYSSELA